jgi:K+-sensing histidine kinase KdpD
MQDQPLDDANEQALKGQIYRKVLSSVSHDLKTPLATMIGSLEVYLLMGKRLTEGRKDELINAALSEAHRLDRFITNILDLTRLEAQSVPVQLAEHDVKRLVEDAIGLLGPLKARGRIEIVPGAVPRLCTDGALFSRALSLALENALRHTGSSPYVTVEISGNAQQGVSVHIRDHGPGIPQGQLTILFSRIDRLKSGDSRNAGTGLGLIIARLIMDLLGGSISAQNHPTTGAVFSYNLPASA